MISFCSGLWKSTKDTKISCISIIPKFLSLLLITVIQTTGIFAFCDDTIRINTSQRCGDVIGEVVITANLDSCLGIYDMFLEGDQNYTLTQEKDYDPGNLIMRLPINIKVIDRTIGAQCTLVVVTGNGTYVKRVFNYYTSEVDVNFLEFDTVDIGETICKPITIFNKSRFRSLYLYMISANGMAFRFNTPTLTILPGDSLKFDACLTPNNYGEYLDTVRFSYAFHITDEECPLLTNIPVHAFVAEPIIHASDHDFGLIKMGDSAYADIIIRNMSSRNLIISSISQVDQHFTFIPLLPDTIGPYSYSSIGVQYKPGTEVGIQHQLTINYNSNASRDKPYSIVTGMGWHSKMDVNDVHFRERVIDQYQINRGIYGYIDTMEFRNSGNVGISLRSLTIIGQDPASFKIRSPLFLSLLDSNMTFPVEVEFTPIDEPMRISERLHSISLVCEYMVFSDIIFDTVNITGIGLQPRLWASGASWGAQKIGDSVIRKIIIRNVDSSIIHPITGIRDGSMPLEVYALELPSNSPFLWYKTHSKVLTFIDPIEILPGDSIIEDVIFYSDSVNSWDVEYIVRYNGAMEHHPSLSVSTYGDPGVESYDGYVDAFYMDSTIIRIPVRSMIDLDVSISSILGQDSSVFTRIYPIGDSLELKGGMNNYVLVRFIPNAVTFGGLDINQSLDNRLPYRDSSFNAFLVFHDPYSKSNDTSHIVGDGKYLEMTSFIPKGYTTKAGQILDVYHYIDSLPNIIDSARIHNFSIDIHYDPAVLHFNGEIIRVNTQMENWAVDSMYHNSGIIRIWFSGSKSSELRSSTIPIYGLRFLGLLSIADSSDITGIIETGINHVVENNLPGIITIDPNCAGDLRIVKFNAPISLEVISNSPLIIRFGVHSYGLVNLDIIDIQGRVYNIERGNYGQGTYETQVNGEFAPGVYIIRYTLDGLDIKDMKIILQ